MLEKELFDLLEGTSDAAFTVTDQGEICSWNKAAEKLFGYSDREALGEMCYRLLQGRGELGTEVCAENCSVRDCAAKHLGIPSFDLEVELRSKDRAWLSISTLVFENSRNHRRLIVHLARDITDRKKKEELLRKMTEVSHHLVEMTEGVTRPAPTSPLSQHETHILRLFSQGKNSETIAQTLGITPQTLRNHLHHINRKLHTHDRLAAVTHAIQRKLL